ncbi:MAG: RelA/SpoT family protein [Elainellaceae cyanobacterium]
MNVIPTPAIPDDIQLPPWLFDCLTLRTDDGLITGAELIRDAFDFAYSLHQGQYRASGEPYILHPIAVADLLQDLGGSATMIAAGFLHDVVEDTEVSPEEIEQRFGAEVRTLVEGVTKLSKFNFSSRLESQAENFRRMFLAMAQDIRVIVVKLADRLHNMRTLEHLPSPKQKRIARETREIFAPLANRLGIGRFKWELEDLAFKYLETEAYQDIKQLISEKRTDREAKLNHVIEVLQLQLAQQDITCVDTSGRPKHLYGIYQKMERQQKEFQQIYDIAAIRIIVDSKDACYRALAVVHDAYRPIPGRFKDYIGLPKSNRYQSLHTVVIGPNGSPIEVQIRTEEMHHIAEYGIAAHWKYKEGGPGSRVTTDDEKFTWLRQLLEWQNDLSDAQEYLESVKVNLFEDEVFVFTPRGDVISLSRGATPVDFAYRIHSEVGNHCCGARINGRIFPLDTLLQNGDIVEILTQKNAHPSLDWLNFVVSAGARNRIRQWYKRSHHDENLARGHDMLERELGKNGFEALLKSEPMQRVVERCNYHAVEDLLAGIGYGEITLNHVVNRLQEAIKTQQPIAPAEDLSNELNEFALSPPIPTKPSTEPIRGIEGLLHNIAGCCSPLPGEPIIGIVTLGSRGISVHQQGCANVDGIPGDRLIPVSWNDDSSQGRPHTYPVHIQVAVLDRVGVLKDVLSRLSDHKINVCSAQVKTDPQHQRPALIDLEIEISNHQQLERIICHIRKMSDVLNLRRFAQSV